MGCFRSRISQTVVPRALPINEVNLNQSLIMELGSLSDDLLLEIMDLVAESIAKVHHVYEKGLRHNGLLSLMRCSRRLYTLGEPILYRKLIQTTSKTLPRFIKTVLAHPNLVEHVRWVILTDQGLAKAAGMINGLPSSTGDVGALDTIEVPRESVGSRQTIAPLSPRRLLFNHEELETIEAIIITVPSEKADSWMRGIKNESWDDFVALTLYLLPNVEDLQIEDCQGSRWQNLGQTRNMLLHNFPFTLKPTLKLRSLCISYKNRTCTDGLVAIPILLLALPTLRSFSGDMIREAGWTNPSPDTKFSIKSLKLERSNFTPTALVNLIKSCPELEVLKYEHDEVHNESRDEYPFFPRQFDEALATLKGVLRELILYRHASGHAFQTVTGAHFSILKSLKNFEKLKTLSITADLLLGPQIQPHSEWYEASLRHSSEAQSLESCLPPSLEHLKLKNCGQKIYDQVKGLIEVKHIVVPDLKTLIVEFVHVRTHSKTLTAGAWNTQLRFATGREAKELNELCQEKGVSFDIWYN